jgi:hypothetical protein
MLRKAIRNKLLRSLDLRADNGSLAAAFALGFLEGRNGGGITYDNDPESPRSQAYDWGRNAREALPAA